MFKDQCKYDGVDKIFLYVRLPRDSFYDEFFTILFYFGEGDPI